MSNKINENFIDFIRKSNSIVSWAFEENETPVFIVPENLTHDYLIKNFNIDSSIYSYYHLPCKHLMTDNEFQTLKNSGYIGDKETVLRPYPINIYGAYYFRPNLIIGLRSFLHSSKYQPNIQGKEIVFFDDLIPYFKEYSNGFKDGFNSFDATHINPYLNTFSDKQDYVNKVFEYITKKIFFSHWASSISGFTININNEITNAFEDGQKQGYYYKAWSYILSSCSLYAPLFQEFLKPQPIVEQKPELKINQIALKYVYESLQITRENSNKIAKQYGHNSGEKLFQRFTYYSSLANRKGKPNSCTPKLLDNKIKLIESVIELLPIDKQGRAKDEVSILKTIYDSEYQ